MTAEIIFAPNKLRIINDDQLQSMLDKFNLVNSFRRKKQQIRLWAKLCLSRLR